MTREVRTRIPPPESPLPAAAAEPAMRTQLQQLREQQEKLFAQLHSGGEHFKRLARSVWRVQEDERRRLARELHDGVGQHLTALRHRLEVLDRTDSSADSGIRTARAPMQEALELCNVAIEEIRALSRMLRPQILDDLGLEAALGWLARHSSEGFGCAIEIEVFDLPATLDGDLSTLIFRVAQEAFANVQKHAQARSVLLRLSRRDDSLQLLIVDDGCGCDVDAAFAKSSAGHSTGLASIRERVRLFSGTFKVVSQPGGGLQIRVSLPLHSEEIES
ncbi:MAG: sensor histidine kinase [Dokdonella sp.]